MIKTKRRNKLIGGSLLSGSFLKTLNGIIGSLGFFIAVGTVGSIEMDRIDFTKGSLIALLSILVTLGTVINYNSKIEKGKW